MLLAIDIGNTNIVFAVYDTAKTDICDALIQSWRIRSDARRSVDEYVAFLKPLFTMHDIEWDSVRSIIISSVVPEADFTLSMFCQKYMGIKPAFVTREMVDVTIAEDISRPGDIGADRLVNALVVKTLYQERSDYTGRPVIVIDFGTATTFDVIDTQGTYIGGVIAPGINLSMAALHQAASKLPNISIEKPERGIGKDTVSAMQSGVYWGYVGLIERILSEITADICGGHCDTDVPAQNPLIIATGGLASLFAKDNASIDQVDETLTLKGLYLLSQAIG